MIARFHSKRVVPRSKILEKHESLSARVEPFVVPRLQSVFEPHLVGGAQGIGSVTNLQHARLAMNEFEVPAFCIYFAHFRSLAGRSRKLFPKNHLLIRP